MGLAKQAKVLSKRQIALVYRPHPADALPRSQSGDLPAVRQSRAAREGDRIADVGHGDGCRGQSWTRAALARRGEQRRLRSRDPAEQRTANGTAGATRARQLSPYVITTERSERTSASAIVNLFASWYRAAGLQGCSSHSGRRTFITNAARTISTVGGSLRDVQMLAGHSALSTTQRYIEADAEAQKRVVDLVLI